VQQQEHISVKAQGNGGLMNFIPLGLMILCTAFIYYHLMPKATYFCNTGIPENPTDVCASFTIPTTEHEC